MQELDVILISFRREDLLKKALSTLAEAVQFFEKDKGSVKINTYFAVNGPDEKTLKIGRAFQKNYPSLNLKIESLNHPLSPAAARNHLLNFSKGDFVFFMDDDVEIPFDIFSNFFDLNLKWPLIDVWGGPNLTSPESSADKKIHGWLLSQPFIVGPITQRYSLARKEISLGGQFNLMLCNLFIRRHFIDQTGFGSFFKTAEENELIYRLQKRGCQMAASDSLFVWHERRDQAKNFLKQVFYYGYGRGQLFFRASILKQKLFLGVPLIAVFVLLKAPWLVLIWIVSIQVQFAFHFRRLSLKILILPAMMWLNYILGLFQGVLHTLKSKFNFNAIKKTAKA